MTPAPSPVEDARRARRLKVASMWNDGASATAIADATGMTVSGVGSAVRRMRAQGWPLAERPPAHDPQQIREALASANETRIARSDLRGRIARGEVSIADLLADPPAPVDKWHALELLRHCPRIGDERIVRFGSDALTVGVNVAMPLGRMATPNRDWIARWIEAAQVHKAKRVSVAPPDWSTARREEVAA